MKAALEPRLFLIKGLRIVGLLEVLELIVLKLAVDYRFNIIRRY